MDELRSAIAHVFMRKDALALPRKDVVMAMSMELRWFSPGEAEKVVDSALNDDLLTTHGDQLKVAFDPASVEVPVGFRPSAVRVVPVSTRFDVESPEREEKGPDEDVCMAIVNRIIAHTGASRQDIVARINAKVLGRGFRGEVAALLVGAEDGVDLKDFFEKVEDGLRK